MCIYVFYHSSKSLPPWCLPFCVIRTMEQFYKMSCMTWTLNLQHKWELSSHSPCWRLNRPCKPLWQTMLTTDLSVTFCGKKKIKSCSHGQYTMNMEATSCLEHTCSPALRLKTIVSRSWLMHDLAVIRRGEEKKKLLQLRRHSRIVCQEFIRKNLRASHFPMSLHLMYFRVFCKTLSDLVNVNRIKVYNIT